MTERTEAYKTLRKMTTKLARLEQRFEARRSCYEGLKSEGAPERQLEFVWDGLARSRETLLVYYAEVKAFTAAHGIEAPALSVIE